MQETVEREVPRDRPPVDFTQAPHKFVESEFPAGKGRCDMCGGGPDAEIHQPRVDPGQVVMERIATALERIAARLEDDGLPVVQA